MIPVAIPDLRGPISRKINEVIKSNWVSSAGPEVELFEKSVAKYVKRKYAISTSSGSSALVLSLIASGIKPGQKVLIPDYTFAATANAVLLMGAIPILVDVSDSNWTLDIDLVSIAIKKYKPSAIIAVDTLGHPFCRDELINICKKSNIILVEDSAGALGSKYKNMLCGSLADISIFSFNGNKIITTGSGGMMLTDNKIFALRAKKYLSQYRKKHSYEYEGVGFNFKMANINAVIGLTQMDYLEKIIDKKQLIAKRYDDFFINRDDIEVMPREKWSSSSCWLYSIRLFDKNTAKSLINYLLKNKIEAKLFWYGLSNQFPYRNYETILSGVSDKLSGTVLSLPCSSSIPAKDQLKVIEVLKKWKGKKLT